MPGTRWICPDCGRTFGAVNRPHECSPAMSIEEYFSTGPPHERPVYEAVAARLDGLDDVVIEPVSVGILFKRARTFAELRPMQRWVRLGFTLDRPLESPRLSRRSIAANNRHHHFVNLASPADVDGTVADWILEAYDACG